MKDFLEQLYDYNCWANGLILKYAEKLPAEQFTQEATNSHGSIRDTLVHIMLAEWFWRLRILGKALDYSQALQQIELEDFPTVQSLYLRWFDEELAMRNLMGDFTDEDFERAIRYTNSAGRELEDKIADILAHVVLHGMQHRAEVAAALTNYGHSPGSLDYSVYLHAE